MLWIDLPPPALATIRITEALTGEILTKDAPGIQVYGKPAGSECSYTGFDTQYDPTAKAWRARTAVGQVTIVVHADTYRSQTIEAFLGTLPQQLDVRMARN